MQKLYDKGHRIIPAFIYFKNLELVKTRFMENSCLSLSEHCFSFD